MLSMLVKKWVAKGSKVGGTTEDMAMVVVVRRGGGDGGVGETGKAELER